MFSVIYRVDDEETIYNYNYVSDYTNSASETYKGLEGRWLQYVSEHYSPQYTAKIVIYFQDICNEIVFQRETNRLMNIFLKIDIFFIFNFLG